MATWHISTVTFPEFNERMSAVDALAISRTIPTTAMIVAGTSGDRIITESDIERTESFGAGLTLGQVSLSSKHDYLKHPLVGHLPLVGALPDHLGLASVEVDSGGVPAKLTSRPRDELFLILGKDELRTPRVVGVFWKTEIMKSVHDVWECPRGDVYPSGGVCPIHGRPLRKR